MNAVRQYNAIASLDWYITQLRHDNLSPERRENYYSEAQKLLRKLDMAVETWQRIRPVYEGRLEKAMRREE